MSMALLSAEAQALLTISAHQEAGQDQEGAGEGGAAGAPCGRGLHAGARAHTQPCHMPGC